MLIEYDEAVMASAMKEHGLEPAHEEGGGGHGGEAASVGLPGILGERYPMIRDAVITVLGSKTAAVLLSPDGKEQIKEELLDSINEAVGLDEPLVVNIYFTDFIIQ